MRFSVASWALALYGVEALNGGALRKLAELADNGLNADGSAMELVQPEAASSFRIATASDITAVSEPPLVAEYVELPLDNFAKNKNYAYDGTFNNRFWVSETFYKAGGPVFLYDVGEGDAEPYAKTRLQNESSFFRQLLVKYNAIGIVWEHRYYGNSTPEPININTPPEVFKWLTTEQSLADVDRFAKQFKRKNISYDLTPSSTPWVFFGGSYPGMRAAFIRDKYPDTIYAGYASSAPTEAKVDMSVYFEPVWRGMNAYGFGNCTKDIQAAVRSIDKTLEKPTAAAKLKEQFLGLGAATNSHATFADALTSIFYLWQAYGIEGGDEGLRNFCDHIATDPATNKTSGAKGWAATKGADFTINRWALWPEFVPLVNYYFYSNCSGSLSVKGDCNLDLTFPDPSQISWTWQYCTQWGFFQSANLGDHQLVSKYNSLQHQKDICHRQFPTATLRDHGFPDWPNVERTNHVFGGWDLRPSNVYWSGGEFDPWRTLSPLSSERQLGAPQPRAFTDAPQCGEGQDEQDIFGYVLKGAQHCYDFRTVNAVPGASVSRAFFTGALDKWLKCFKPKKGSGGGHH